nr:site-specific integrase [uncultured Carboxylicivirga sp.]
MSLDKVNTRIILKQGKIWLNKKDEYPIKLSVTFKGKRKQYTIKGESCISSEEFELIMNPNSKGERKKKRKKYTEIQDRADLIIENLPEFTFEAFEREFIGTKERQATLQEYFNNKVVELTAHDKPTTAETYTRTLKSLSKFDKGLSFEKVTDPKYLKKYENWFVNGDNDQNKKGSKKPGSYTTLGIYMRNLRHILNLALEDKTIKSYPFGSSKNKYQIPVSNNTKKALSISEIEKLVTYQPTAPEEIKAQKYWLFSYLCNGMNMADIANLKYKNIQNNSLKFIRQKTRDTSKVKTEIDVYLTPEAKEIINSLGNTDKQPESYIFPILRSGLTVKQIADTVKQHIKITNKYMKRIADTVGIDKTVTTYGARHSYATVLKRSGVSTEFIREALGHQTGQTTQNYLDSFEEEHKEKTAANLLNFKK